MRYEDERGGGEEPEVRAARGRPGIHVDLRLARAASRRAAPAIGCGGRRVSRRRTSEGRGSFRSTVAEAERMYPRKTLSRGLLEVDRFRAVNPTRTGQDDTLMSQTVTKRIR